MIRQIGIKRQKPGPANSTIYVYPTHVCIYTVSLVNCSETELLVANLDGSHRKCLIVTFL